MIRVGSKVRNATRHGLPYVGVVVAYVPPGVSGRGVARMKRLKGASRLRDTYRVRGSWLVEAVELSARTATHRAKRSVRVFWPIRVEEVADA